MIMNKMDKQEIIPKIKQLLKSEDSSNHYLAVELMKGQCITVDEMIDTITIEEDSDYNYKWSSDDYVILCGFMGEKTGYRPSNEKDIRIKLELVKDISERLLSKIYNK